MTHFNAMCRVSMMTHFNAMCRVSMMTHVSKWWLTSMECAELLECLMVAPASGELRHLVSMLSQYVRPSGAIHTASRLRDDRPNLVRLSSVHENYSR